MGSHPALPSIFTEACTNECYAEVCTPPGPPPLRGGLAHETHSAASMYGRGFNQVMCLLSVVNRLTIPSNRSLISLLFISLCLTALPVVDFL